MNRISYNTLSITIKTYLLFLIGTVKTEPCQNHKNTRDGTNKESNPYFHSGPYKLAVWHRKTQHRFI